MRKARWIVLVVASVLALGACTNKNAATQARNSEQAATSKDLVNQLKAQPIPVRPWSQLRQNLIEIETAQMDSTQTTSFMFNQGVQDPVQTCPSIGFPIPSTAQLTNPDQKVQHHDLTLPQIDPNGVYAGQSTGTYIICVDAQGRAYADYWEGFVQTVTGPATWDAKSHSVSLVGPPSFKFSTEKK